jgi:plastocyanin
MVITGLGPSPTHALDGQIDVMLQAHQFNPATIRAKPGETIRFVNTDPTLHSLILVDRPDALAEQFVDPGTTFSFRVPDGLAAGAYELACTIHVDMRGQLLVSSP